LKKALIIAGGVFAALLIAALVIPGFLNWNQYKAQIENAAEAATGRDVTIDGDISLSILPAPAFSVAKLSLANLPEGTTQPMMALDALDVRIRLFPLLKGRLDIEKIVLVAPRLNLEVLPDGRPNWEFARAGDTGTEPTDEGIATDVRVNRFVIEDGIVTYRDAVSGTVEKIDAVNAVISADSLNGPFKVRGDMVARQIPLAFALSLGQTGNGKIPASLDVMLAEASSEMAFRGLVALDAPRSAEGTFKVKGSNFGALVASIMKAAGGDTQTPDIKKPVNIEAAFVAEETGFRTTAMTLALGASRGEGKIAVNWEKTPDFMADLSFGTLDIDELVPASSNDIAGTGKTEAGGLLPDPGVLVPDGMTGRLALTAEAVRFHDRAVRQFRVAGHAADGTLQLDDFRALLPGGGDIKLTGAVTRPSGNANSGPARFDGTLDAKVNNLRDILAWFEVEPEGLQPGRLSSFAVNGDVYLTAAEAGLRKGLVRVDTANFKGDLGFTDGAPFKVMVSGAIDRLDPGYYMAKGATCLPKEESEPSEDPFTRFNADLNLKIGRLTCPETRLDGLAFDGTVQAGLLKIRNFSADQVAGLKLAASGEVAKIWTAPSYSLTLNAGGQSLAEVDRLFPGLLPRPPAYMGAPSFSGKVAGTTSDIGVEGTLGLGGTSAAGRVRVALKPEGTAGEDALPIKALDANMSLKAASLAQFIEQWDLPLARPETKDDRPLSLKGTVKGDMAAMALDLAGQIAAADLSLSGQIRQLETAPLYDLTLAVDGQNMRTVLRGLGLAFEPADPKLGPLKLNASVSGGSESLAIKIPSGQAGPMVFNGVTNISFSDDHPMIAGDIRAGDVPLDRFLAPSDPSTAKKDGKHEWSREPFHNEWLDSFDANFMVRADSVTLRDYRFDQPKFTVAVTNGMLEVRDLTGKLFDGDVALAMKYGGKAASDLALNVSLVGASLEKALGTAFGVNALTGTIGFDSAITGKGASPYDLVRALNGATKVNLSEGLVRGIDLPRLSQNMKTMDSVQAFGRVLGSALSGGSTRHKGVATTITTRDGTFNLKDLVVELDAAKALLGAQVDLVKWQVTSGGRLQMTEHPTAPPIGVDIGGNLTSPAVKYQTSEIKSFMAAEISKALLNKATGGGIDQLLGIPKKPATTPEGGTGDETVVPSTEPAQAQPETSTPETQKKDPARDLFRGILESLQKKDQQKSE
jgi:uncharacterized protein involved in outer membrane biogenesis